ncbi:MAG: hypothetical protein J3K34DRAFT_404101 [Monoraphidium minutum]|nr:MAG: hypothetical protein J3K34DRAFT_404101 [Monoraphidium minutum]
MAAASDVENVVVRLAAGGGRRPAEDLVHKLQRLLLRLLRLLVPLEVPGDDLLLCRLLLCLLALLLLHTALGTPPGRLADPLEVCPLLLVRMQAGQLLLEQAA